MFSKRRLTRNIHKHYDQVPFFNQTKSDLFSSDDKVLWHLNSFLFFDYDKQEDRYKEWVHLWRMFYNELTQATRFLKSNRKIGGSLTLSKDSNKMYQRDIERRIAELKDLANNFLMARKRYKLHRQFQIESEKFEKDNIDEFRLSNLELDDDKTREQLINIMFPKKE